MPQELFPDESTRETTASTRAGFRYGARGTHTSRTMMLAELTEVLEASAPGVDRQHLAMAIIEENILGKSTTATRKLSHQRLSELYGLDPKIPLFRILERLWPIDPAARPQLALLAALARDPLLRTSADAIMPLRPGEEISRGKLIGAIQKGTGDRFNESVCDKVARNVASTWAQSGHLEGRVRKVRRKVNPGATSIAFAIWLGWIEGMRGAALWRTGWIRVLDASPAEARELAFQAKTMNLINVLEAGAIVEIDPAMLDPERTRVW